MLSSQTKTFGRFYDLYRKYTILFVVHQLMNHATILANLLAKVFLESSEFMFFLSQRFCSLLALPLFYQLILKRSGEKC